MVHITRKLRFNFGFLLEGNPGESRVVELDYPAVELDDVMLAPLRGKFRASRTAGGIYLKGTLYTEMQVACARCTELFTLPVEIDLDDHYYTPDLAPPDEYIIDARGILDLGPLLRELAVTAVPMQAVCLEACRGLCVECGQNLNEGDCACEVDNIDPRMAVLKQLLDREE